MIKLQPILGLNVDQLISSLNLTPDGTGIWCGLRYRGFDIKEDHDEICLLTTLPHVKTKEVMDDEASYCVLQPNGKLLATTFSVYERYHARKKQHGVRIWDTETKALIWQRDGVAGGQFMPTSHYFLTGGQADVKVFDYEKDKLLGGFDASPIWTVLRRFIACHPSGNFVSAAFSADSTSVIRFVQAADDWRIVEEWDIKCKSTSLTGGIFSPCGKYFAFCDGDIHLYSFAPPHYLTSLRAQRAGLDIAIPSCNPGLRTGKFTALRFTPDSSTLICCATDGQVFLWEIATDVITFQIKGHEGPIRGLDLSLDGKTLITSGIDRILSVWALDISK